MNHHAWPESFSNDGGFKGFLTSLLLVNPGKGGVVFQDVSSSFLLYGGNIWRAKTGVSGNKNSWCVAVFQALGYRFYI